MHDFIIAASFIAMVLTPCFIAATVGSSTEAEA